MPIRRLLNLWVSFITSGECKVEGPSSSLTLDLYKILDVSNSVFNLITTHTTLFYFY